MNIVVTTSDKYMHLLPAFAHLFNKYFDPGQPVTVLGFSQPTFDLPGNFCYCSIGKQEEFPFSRWSDALMRFLDLHPHWDRFLLFLEDYLIVRQVDTWAICLAYEYMKNHPDVLKIDLYSDRLYAGGMTDFAYLDRLDLIKSDPASAYHFSWMPGIWSVPALRRVMIEGESCHDMEIYGTPRVAALKDELVVLGTRNLPLRITLAYRRDVEGINLEGLRDCDIEELKELGYL